MARPARKYLPRCWADPRVERRDSPIHGKGGFATAPIKEGEVVVIWGGTVFTEEELRSGNAPRSRFGLIDDGLYLATAPDDDQRVGLNHSCDPNLGMQDEVTMVARRDIQPGEELTVDYAMCVLTEATIVPFTCRCGSKLCRGTITAEDWRLTELQERYGGHFAPFVNQRIRAVLRGEIPTPTPEDDS